MEFRVTYSCLLYFMAIVMYVITAYASGAFRYENPDIVTAFHPVLPSLQNCPRFDLPGYLQATSEFIQMSMYLQFAGR
jgi:hypothetical protein